MDKTRKYDVIVTGGGMAGCAAAIASAESGSKTLLIENFGFLGGWGTAALVNPFMFHWASDGKILIKGLFEKINNAMYSADGMLANTFDTETLIYLLQEMVLASGAELRLHTLCEKANTSEDGIFIQTISKSGDQVFQCKRLIDCSGDGDLAVSLGAEYESGNSKGLPQAATLMFDVGGVNPEKLLSYVKDHPDQMRFPKLAKDVDVAKLANEVYSVAGYYDLIEKAKQAGEYDVPGDMIFFNCRPHKGEVTFNTTHVGNIDGTNADDLTRGEIEGRRQMMSVARFVKKYVQGFENSYLLRSAAHIGIRETRRIVGDYKFCGSDVTSARKFDDGICRLAYPIDIHSGEGEGYTKEEAVKVERVPPHGDWYEIPYRCLIPKGIDGVLVAGRCVSSTQEGNGAIRIMPSCVAMGEAAGVAVSLSLKHEVSLRDIDIKELKNTLRRRGALV